MTVLKANKEVHIKVLPRVMSSQLLNSLMNGSKKWGFYSSPRPGNILAIESGDDMSMKLSELDMAVHAALVFVDDYSVQGYKSTPFIAPDMYLEEGIVEIGTIRNGVPYFIHISDTSIRYIVLRA